MLSNFQTVLCLPVHHVLTIFSKKLYNEVNIIMLEKNPGFLHQDIILFFQYKVKNKSLNKILFDKEINNGKIWIFFLIEKFGCTLHNFWIYY